MSPTMLILGIVLGFLLCWLFFFFRRKGSEEQPVVARMALRRTLHSDKYLDIDFNIRKGETDQEIVSKVRTMFDLSGIAHEKIKEEVEEENEKKRQASRESKGKDAVRKV